MNTYLYNTKVGKISITGTENEIISLSFSGEIPKNSKVKETALLAMAAKQLMEYLNGDRTTFDLPLHFSGTPFQQKVWQALATIPYGKTISYKELAQAIGSPKACRAVGMANNKNPLPIFLPCHRVIGSNGKLVGYGGGLDLKEMLLELEKNNRLKLNDLRREHGKLSETTNH